jgi:hypothetical protein
MAHGDPGTVEHTNLRMVKQPCPCPTHLELSGAALAGATAPELHATALLLAGETFLASARDPHKPLEVRAQLERAGLRLIEKSARNALELK